MIQTKIGVAESEHTFAQIITLQNTILSARSNRVLGKNFAHLTGCLLSRKNIYQLKSNMLKNTI